MSISIFFVLFFSVKNSSNLFATDIEKPDSVQVNTKFEENSYIYPITREFSSGTRMEFVKYFNLLKDDISYIYDDSIFDEARVEIRNSDLLHQVATNSLAISYISNGYIKNNEDSRIKTISIDNVEPTAENVKNGLYDLTVPFYMVYNYKPRGATEDFINFIFSKEGKNIIEKKYISVLDESDNFTNKVKGGSIVIYGSESSKNILNDLINAYKQYNKSVNIEVKIANSMACSFNTFENMCDISFINRELTKEEMDKLYTEKIALDYLCIIKNANNTTENLSTDDINKIFSGVVTNWSEVSN